ncbi:MAG: FadR family transcriptional regulator [Deltaproteobacteria bacterium]|jgi:GntR family transcriptional repressor for pyruvate dehydrogenase complex|nr:FadR family transcriptional regulator [Deltaproteobacteria bacterium]
MTKTEDNDLTDKATKPNKAKRPDIKLLKSASAKGSGSTGKLFKPAAKKEKIPTIIIRQIRSAILQGKLKPGQALANEKELIEQFDVSKHTLREALRTLEGMGLLTIKRGAGGGPVISEIGIDTARDNFASFLFFQNVARTDISELRKLAEPYIARWVAENVTPEMVGDLEKIQGECRTLVEQGKSLVGAEAEIMFHVYLARQTNNRILWIVMDFVNNMLAEIKMAMKPGQAFSEQVLAAHQEILDAIKAGDPDRAEKAMYAHICEVADALDLIDHGVN